MKLLPNSLAWGAAGLLLLISCATGATGDRQTIHPVSTEGIQVAKAMGLGWNLGNTLEACSETPQTWTVDQYETSWGQPRTTKAMFDGIKAAGFQSVRIPVAWSNLISADNTINPDLMNRVEEVVNYALDDQLYVVLNIHWDGGWITRFPVQYDQCLAKYRKLWTQISDRFRNASPHLIFESMNEEGCFNDLWNRYDRRTDSGKSRAYQILNTVNQEFTNIVRASGGNNADRFLLIAGYATDIDLTCAPLFKLPDDPAQRLLVSVHYYTPATFTILDHDASWGKAASTWGTNSEVATVHSDFQKLKKRFLDRGIAVILGEYGAGTKNKDPVSVQKYLITVAQTAWDEGICPMLWDTGDFYSRQTGRFKDPNLATQYQAITGTSTDRR